MVANDPRRFRALAIKHSLKIEIETGMRRRGRPILQIAREHAGIHFANKKEAYKWFSEQYP